MNGIGIESRSHRKDSVMDKKIGLSTEAKATASDQGTSPVIATAAELNPNPTKPTANDAVIDATSMVEDSEVMVATVPDSIPTVMAT